MGPGAGAAGVGGVAVTDKAPHAWVLDGEWLHRPWWKVAANTVLRLLQRSRHKYVFFTVCDVNGDERPRATGYGFGRVEHIEPALE